MFGHILFMAVDMMIYLSLVWFIFDGFYAWIAYYCYMTLSKFSIYGYIAALGYGTVSGVLAIFTVLSKAGGIGIILFPG